MLLWRLGESVIELKVLAFSVSRDAFTHPTITQSAGAGALAYEAAGLGSIPDEDQLSFSISL